MAGYYKFAQLRPSVPFIVDDIMETFDHVRSRRSSNCSGKWRQLAMIYLTHHQHLCDIARAVAPGVAIHELA
ncbi:hypothetical protein CK227_25110 [Mesorhizobium sp. WSM4308]|nr:hypothetical protein CK232_24255 [Mesorhizobium sp. WSM4304]PBB72928.1 hypothetical protein CK227_25110 [Mesorhizobium sp. WSM4308]